MIRRFKVGLVSLGAMLLVLVVPSSQAQRSKVQQEACFVIHVWLNGKPLADPRTVTLTTKQEEINLTREGSCFNVPSSLLKEKDVDVSLAVPGNKLYLSKVSGSFFSSPWDIDVGNRGHKACFCLAPQGQQDKDACTVTFHDGDPEIQMTQTHCRTHLKN